MINHKEEEISIKVVIADQHQSWIEQSFSGKIMNYLFSPRSVLSTSTSNFLPKYFPTWYIQVPQRQLSFLKQTTFHSLNPCSLFLTVLKNQPGHVVNHSQVNYTFISNHFLAFQHSQPSKRPSNCFLFFSSQEIALGVWLASLCFSCVWLYYNFAFEGTWVNSLLSFNVHPFHSFFLLSLPLVYPFHHPLTPPVLIT